MLLCHTFQGFYIFWGNGLGTAFLGHLINDQCIMCVANIKWTVGCFSCGFGNALEPLEWAKTLMSRCFKIFRYFRRYTQNWMQKWTFLQKWRAHNWSSIKVLHYRPLQHFDRPNLSELWQKCDWRDFWSFLGLFFAGLPVCRFAGLPVCKLRLEEGVIRNVVKIKSYLDKTWKITSFKWK